MGDNERDLKPSRPAPTRSGAHCASTADSGWLGQRAAGALKHGCAGRFRERSGPLAPVIDGCVTLSGARTCRGDVAGRARSSVGESLEAVEDEVEGEPELVVGGGVGTVELNVFGDAWELSLGERRLEPLAGHLRA